MWINIIDTALIMQQMEKKEIKQLGIEKYGKFLDFTTQLFPDSGYVNGIPVVNLLYI